MSKSVVRSVKNVTKGYSHVEKKVRNATSNDAWGPSGTEMSEIAQLTYNGSNDFYEIVSMLDKRLNDKGKNWRHVLKSLKVLDYCLHEGSEQVVTWARKNIYIIRTLREFQYIDEDHRDVGQNVRVSAKELTALIMDEERLRAERHDRKLWKSRVTSPDDITGPVEPPPGRPPQRNRPKRDDEDDLEYRLAIEASKNEAEEDARRRAGKAAPVDDDDLARAIRLSKEEEDQRRRELEDNNASALFDNEPAQAAQPQATGWNQGYQQQGAVNWSGDPVDQQQAQSTGYLNNAYAQPHGLQNQSTGYQNGYGYGQYQQPQQTGFDQSQLQAQNTYMQPQQTAFNMNNPYSQQQQQPLQQQNTVQPGTNNPWASSSVDDSSIRPQPTGSNNPFGASFGRPQTAQQPQSQHAPTLQTLSEQKTATQFNPPISYQATSSKPQNPQHANLNALLASGEGQDTFGNTGDLRIPAQHTAPGTFFNSAGTGIGRLQANQTGSNPFVHNQFTGGPLQNQHLMPSQTGPVGAYGGGAYGSANPFGASGPSQGQRPSQGNSLIDI